MKNTIVICAMALSVFAIMPAAAQNTIHFVYNAKNKTVRESLHHIQHYVRRSRLNIRINPIYDADQLRNASNFIFFDTTQKKVEQTLAAVRKNNPKAYGVMVTILPGQKTLSVTKTFADKHPLNIDAITTASLWHHRNRQEKQKIVKTHDEWIQTVFDWIMRNDKTYLNE